jgi:hypothetical protein
MENSNILAEIKKCITYIYIIKDNKLYLNGTGFFIRIPQEKNTSKGVGYLVTAKHVVIDEKNRYQEKIVIRLNNKNGGSTFSPIDLKEYNIFTHTDSEVDIAVIPIRPDPSIIDFLFIPSEMFVTKEKIKELEITEGCDVFFSSFFNSYLGQERNEPILRFGKLSLLPESKILSLLPESKISFKINQSDNPKLMDLYLVECLSFGGNSGSPAFFNLGIGQVYSIYFAGVVIGSFHNTEIFAYDTFLKQNVGIAAIVPAFKLVEILLSENVCKHRQLIQDV